MDGFCTSHGTIKYGEADISEDTGKMLCPKCRMVLRMPFEFVLGKSYRLFQCPLNEIDPEALYLVKLVNWSEKVGITPSGCSLFDETSWYSALREFVLYEQGEAREELVPKHNQQSAQSKQGSLTSKAVRRR